MPAFQDRQAVTLYFGKIKEGESRLVESQIVNPSTYSELSYAFNEGYREARANIRSIGFEIVQADKMYRKKKSELILDEYPAFLKTVDMKDNATLREAFLEKNQELEKIQDRIDMLKAMHQLMEDKIKVFENACKYMKVQMDLIKGSFNSNKY